MTDIVSPETSAVVEAVVTPAGSLEESTAVEASVTEPTTGGAAAEQSTPSSEEGLTEAQAAEEDLAQVREESAQNMNGVLQVCARSKHLLRLSCLSVQVPHRTARGRADRANKRSRERSQSKGDSSRRSRSRSRSRSRCMRGHDALLTLLVMLPESNFDESEYSACSHTSFAFTLLTLLLPLLILILLFTLLLCLL